MMAMMAGGVPIETPSRILRRIQQAQDDEDSHFDSLPSLPHPDVSGEAHLSTFAFRDPRDHQGSSDESVQAAGAGANVSDSFDATKRPFEATPAAPSRDRVLTVGGNKRMPGMDQTPMQLDATPAGLSLPTLPHSPAASPYSSTPATTAAYHANQSQSRTLTGLDQNAGGGNWSRHQLVQSRRGIEADLSAAGIDSSGEISKNLEADDKDEMVVLSGGSGTDENEPPAQLRAAMRRSVSDRRRRSTSSFKGSPLAHVPEERTEELRQEMAGGRERPGGESGEDGEGSWRRQLSFGGSDLDDLDDLASEVDPEALERESVERRQSGATVHGGSAASFATSPGVGRRDSRHNSFSVEIPQASGGDESLPRDAREQTPFSAFSASVPQKEKTYATPKLQTLGAVSSASEAEEGDRSASPEAQSRAALERRKSHLLSTLQLTAVRSAAKARMAKGTPFARRVAGRAQPDLVDSEDESLNDLRVPNVRPDDDTGDASALSSENDLTTFGKGGRVDGKGAHRHLNGNTSFPAAGASGDHSQRFNGAKLNAYLHTLNTHLTEENQTLIKTLQDASRENALLKREREGLEEALSSANDASDSEPRRVRRNAVDEPVDPSLVVLTAELDRAREALSARDADIIALRTQLLESRGEAFRSEEGEGTRAKLVTDLQKRVFSLQDDLASTRESRAQKEAEITSLKAAILDSVGRSAALGAGAQGSLEEAFKALKEKDVEVEELRAHIQAQDQDFAEKMAILKEEMVKVVQEQDQKIDEALDEASELKQEKKKREAETKTRLEALERRLRETDAELQEAREQRQELMSSQQGSDTDAKRISLLQDQISRLETTVANKERLVQDAAFEASQKADQHAAEVKYLESQIAFAKTEAEDAKKQVQDIEAAMKQMEEALDESEKQMLSYDSGRATLQGQLDVAETTIAAQSANIAALEAKLSQTAQTAFRSSISSSAAPSPVKTPRPARPGSNDAQDSTVAALEEELDEAYREIGRLKNRAQQDPNAVAAAEIQQLRIKTLESQRTDLSERVTSLRQQVLLRSPVKTPGPSMLFRSVSGIKTPKTPGAMLANMTNFSPYSPGPDGTISPLLSQIHQLEQQISRLQLHLDRANENVDEKLEKLQAAGVNTITLAEQLGKARERTNDLEDKLDGLLGKNGIVIRVQKRLAKLPCPECQTVFDANEVVRFRVRTDEREIDLPEDETLARANESLANVKAQLRRLQTENSTLRDGQKDKHSAAALKQELASARAQMSKLEAELRSERDKLRQALEEQTQVIDEKAMLEAKVRQADEALANVKTELTRVTRARDAAKVQLQARDVLDTAAQKTAGSRQVAELQASMAKLRNDRAMLTAEKSSLLSRLAAIEAEADQFRTSIGVSRKSQDRMQRQLKDQSEELHGLRLALEDKAGEVVKLRDEKDNVLRGVVNLQTDLRRVQSEAQALGDELGQMREDTGDLGSARELRRELDAVKTELRQATRGTADVRMLAQLHAQHSRECKGLLLRIRYLKVLFTRESQYRADLAAQKMYLADQLEDAEARTTSIQLALAEFGLPCATDGPLRLERPSFKAAAHAVRLLCRMRILARRWAKEQNVKTALKTAYSEVRGKPFEG